MSSPVTFTAAGTAPPSAGAPASLQHAVLELLEPPAGGGTGQPGRAVLDIIEFQFNPKELSLTKNAKWKREAQRNARKSGPPEFTGSDPSKLSLEMFFDATDSMDEKVVKAVEKLFSCCVPTEKSRQDKKGSPPWVVFRWGGLTSFPAYVSSVTAKYTLFTPSGTPVRALCTVTLEEISGEQSGQNPTSGSVAARDIHVVVAGDTLASVAFRAYGDPALWRRIAQASNIDDPMRLRPGTRLLIPAPDEPGGPHGQ
ncbi:LysM peptidoglycan-binding domain-containing protein [Micromonospora sp. DT47]|uniref:CIS tube protein n=1 Tax=Micromonospora sp. DT47 TaxID=3393431 RepID=UPI003CFA0BED